MLTRVGAKTGQVNFAGKKVRIGKIVVGALSGGTNGDPFVIQFNSSATVTHAQAVLQRVTMKGLRGKLSPGVRTIEVVATDPSLQSSIPQTREVTVSA